MNQIYEVYFQKYIDTKSDIQIALLQIRLASLGPGLPGPTALLFNHPIRGIMSIINRPLISSNNDDDDYEVLVKRQKKNDENHDTSRNYASIPIASTVAVWQEDGGLWTHCTVVGKGGHNYNYLTQYT